MIKLLYDEQVKSLLSVEDKFKTFVDIKNENAKLKSEICDLNTKLFNLHLKNEELEAFSRRDNVILSGVSIPNTLKYDELENKIFQLFSSELNIQLLPSDISIVHRIGKSSGDNDDNLLIRFSRRSIKYRLQEAARSIKPKFYLNDHLTPLNSKLYYELRQLGKKSPDVISTYIRNGLVYAKLNGGLPSRISSPEDLQGILSSIEK